MKKTLHLSDGYRNKETESSLMGRNATNLNAHIGWIDVHYLDTSKCLENGSLTLSCIHCLLSV